MIVKLPISESKEDGSNLGNASKLTEGLLLIPSQPILADGLPLIQPTGASEDPLQGHDPSNTSQVAGGLPSIPSQPIHADGLLQSNQ